MHRHSYPQNTFDITVSFLLKRLSILMIASTSNLLSFFFMCSFWSYSISFISLHAQELSLPCGEGKGVIGKEGKISLCVPLENDSTYEFRASLFLKNPTVFYPQRLQIADIDSTAWTIRGVRLQRWTDSTWALRAVVSRTGSGIPRQELKMELCGETLAGSDTLTTGILDSVALNSKPVNAQIFLFRTDNLGLPLFYVRFARLNPSYPNPVSKNQFVTWAYLLDKPGKITFQIYNSLGQRIEETTLDQTLGVHTYSIQTNGNYGSGLYWLFMIAETGVLSQPFLVINP